MERRKISARFIIIYAVIKYIPHLIALLWILSSGEYRSEFREANLIVTMEYANIYLVFILFLLLLLLPIIFFYFCDQERRLVISSNLCFKIKRKKLELYLAIMMFLNIYLLFTTGVGKAGGEYKSSSLSAILALLNFDFFFWIYFIKYYEEKNKRYYFICFLYMTLQLLQGWSSFVLSFFFIVLCMSSSKWQRRLLWLLPFIFLVGGAAYTIMFPLKMLVRYGKWMPVSYAEGLLHLFERLTSFPNACVAVQLKERILNLYYHLNISNEEVMAYFYPWVPGQLMPYKSQRLFNNLVMLAVYSGYSVNTSAGMGASYIYMLGQLHWSYILLYLCAYLFNYFAIKLMSNLLIDGDSVGLQYLSFLALFKMVDGFSFRQLGSFIPAIWTFLILIFLGCIKIYVRRNESATYLY